MFGRNSLPKMRTAPSEISRPAYVNQRDKQKSLLPLFADPAVLGMPLDGRERFIYDVGYIRTYRGTA
jgi:hypothetical protein